MARRRSKGRALNGLLLLDKPSGISSNSALQKAKRIYNAAKAGHTGSLDPLATGLLVICFGRATKISDYLLNADKEYRVTVKLGITTDTGDADGTIIMQQDASHITDKNILDNISKLIGEIEQIPPMHSALKHKGKRLYVLAREGKQVERKPRSVVIYKFELLARNADVLKTHVYCSKGTYIRTLIEDLGTLLGCGAHVTELRRVSLGPFANKKMHTLEELKHCEHQGDAALDDLLTPIDQALQTWPALLLNETLMTEVVHGHPVFVPKTPDQGVVRLYDSNRHFFGVGRILNDGRIAPKCLS